MTPQQAGVSAEALAKLLQLHSIVVWDDQWRCRCSGWALGNANGTEQLFKSWAEHFVEQALLATAPPEQAALSRHTCDSCGQDLRGADFDGHYNIYCHKLGCVEHLTSECGCDSSKGVLCDAHNPIMQSAERSLPQPQAASAGALSAELEDRLNYAAQCTEESSTINKSKLREALRALADKMEERCGDHCANNCWVCELRGDLRLILVRTANPVPLAAHDQKVRADTLQEAILAFKGAYSDHSDPLIGVMFGLKAILSLDAPAPAASKPEADARIGR